MRSSTDGESMLKRLEPGDTIVGFFDSGVGGLSVWREVVSCRPAVRTLYVADSGHCPYGSRTAEEITDFSRSITRFLLEMGARAIVVACNTASAAALETLRAEFALPFVGMEPAVKPAAEQSRSGHVGVLATENTLNGTLFRQTSARFAAGVSVHVQPGTGLVELVEAGRGDSQEAETLLRAYLSPMVAAGVDQIALGCTHYPLLLPMMRRLVPAGVSIIDPATAVARQVERTVATLAPSAADAGGDAPKSGWRHRLFTTGDVDVLASLAASIAGKPMPVERLAWKGNDLVPVRRSG